VVNTDALCKALHETAQLLRSPYIPFQHELVKLYHIPGDRRPDAEDLLSNSYYFFDRGGLSPDLALLCVI